MRASRLDSLAALQDHFQVCLLHAAVGHVFAQCMRGSSARAPTQVDGFYKAAQKVGKGLSRLFSRSKSTSNAGAAQFGLEELMLYTNVRVANAPEHRRRLRDRGAELQRQHSSMAGCQMEHHCSPLAAVAAGQGDRAIMPKLPSDPAKRNVTKQGMGCHHSHNRVFLPCRSQSQLPCSSSAVSMCHARSRCSPACSSTRVTRARL